MDNVIVRDFRQNDQSETRKLIMRCIKPLSGTILKSQVRDLSDIAASYKQGLFVVAEHIREQELIGSAGLLPHEDGVAEVTRLTVDSHYRRRGVATDLLHMLVSRARAAGAQSLFAIVPETYREANVFFVRFGFRDVGRAGGSVQLRFDTSPSAASSAALDESVVSTGMHVSLVLIDKFGAADLLSCEVVPDGSADFARGLLGESTPLAKAIMGRGPGSVVPYKAGDMKEVRIEQVTRGAALPEDLTARRAATHEKLVRESEQTETLLFSLAFSSKWGDYDPDRLASAADKSDK